MLCRACHWKQADAWWDMSYNVSLLPSCCRDQAGVVQQTAVLPAVESRSSPCTALWGDRLHPPAIVLRRPPPAPSGRARGRAEGRRWDWPKCPSVWRCWTRTTQTDSGLKQVAATVSVGRTGTGEGRRGQRHVAGRWHHHGTPGGLLTDLVPGRNSDKVK